MKLQLITTSKVKALVKEEKLHTSASVIELLNLHVSYILKEAGKSAVSEGRKTLMDRDVTSAIYNFRMNTVEKKITNFIV